MAASRAGAQRETAGGRALAARHRAPSACAAGADPGDHLRLRRRGGRTRAQPQPGAERRDRHGGPSVGAVVAVHRAPGDRQVRRIARILHPVTPVGRHRPGPGGRARRVLRHRRGAACAGASESGTGGTGTRRRTGGPALPAGRTAALDDLPARPPGLVPFLQHADPLAARRPAGRHAAAPGAPRADGLRKPSLRPDLRAVRGSGADCPGGRRGGGGTLQRARGGGRGTVRAALLAGDAGGLPGLGRDPSGRRRERHRPPHLGDRAASEFPDAAAASAASGVHGRGTASRRSRRRRAGHA